MRKEKQITKQPTEADAMRFQNQKPTKHKNSEIEIEKKNLHCKKNILNLMEDHNTFSYLIAHAFDSMNYFIFNLQKRE